MSGTPFLCTLPNSARVYGVSWGDAEASLLLLHDYGEDLDSVRPLARSVSRRGWRTIALDLPGHGLSDAVPGNVLSQSALAALHHYLVGRGWGPLFIAGVGMSAEVARGFSKLPEVAGLILISPAPLAVGSGQRLSVPTLLFVPNRRPEVVQAVQDLCASAEAYWLRALLPTDQAGSALLRGRWLSQINSHLVGFLVEVLALYRSRVPRREPPEQVRGVPGTPVD